MQVFSCSDKRTSQGQYYIKGIIGRDHFCGRRGDKARHAYACIYMVLSVRVTDKELAGLIRDM
jgi:hypothetical protein